jgi:tetratricopeptide (TPR) repeat protein
MTTVLEMALACARPVFSADPIQGPKRPTEDIQHFSEGATFLQSGKEEESVKAFEKALKLNPNDPGSWMGKGLALGLMKRASDSDHAFQKSFDLREDFPDGGRALYATWTVVALAQGLGAMLGNDIRSFEEAGLKYIDILEKAEQDGMGQAVEDALVQFEERLKKPNEKKAFEELEVFIRLMRIKDPFEGWRALGKEVSKRWPKGHSVVKAVREMRR